MSDRIVRLDLHSEVAPNGSKVVMEHMVNAPVSATQSLVQVGGKPVLRQGDTFRAGHAPKIGPFAQPLPGGTGQGRLAQSGQAILKINGELVVNRDGTNTSCSEGVREMSNQATTLLAGRPLVKLNGAVVLVGEKSS